MAAEATVAPPPGVATALSVLLGRGANRSHSLRVSCPRCVSSDTVAEPAPTRRGGHAGTRLEEVVPAAEGRSRVDAWISACLGGGGIGAVARGNARVQRGARRSLAACPAGRHQGHLNYLTSDE